MKSIFLLLFFGIAFNVQASSINPTKIERILVGPQYGNRVFLAISQKPSTVPSCQTNGSWNYVFDGSTASGKMYLSVALSAYSAGKSVYLAGSDICTIYSNVENLRHIVTQ